VSDYCGGPSRT